MAMEMPHARQQEAPSPRPTHQSSKLGQYGPVRLLVMAWLVLSVIGLLGLLFKAGNALLAAQAVKGNKYQVVFLTNNQFYFGKVSQVNDSFVKLTDIYYLQVQQQVQPDNKSTAQPNSVSLIKLGDELHAPDDVMYINRDQVLFWENLKDDGKVVQAIKQEKSKK